MKHNDIASVSGDNAMSVLVAGRPLCSTANSTWLDPQTGGIKHFENRQRAAQRIALCWNVCRNLSDEQLADLLSNASLMRKTQ